MVKNNNNALETVRGVVFGRSIRAYYAMLHVAASMSSSDEIGADDNQNYSYVAVHIRFENDSFALEFRSWCRRVSKLGDLLCLRGTFVEPTLGRTDATTSGEPGRRELPHIPNGRRLLIQMTSIEQANQVIQVETIRYWSMPTCQLWQQKYRPKHNKDDAKEESTSSKSLTKSNEQTDRATARHGGCIEKRQKGEYVATFLVNMMQQKLGLPSDDLDVGDWATASLSDNDTRHAVLSSLNERSGVLDAAGGSGYVSMALGLRGVKSTVVDPRESAGKLPKRDRKVWNRALAQQTLNNASTAVATPMLCHPVATPYDTVRAWFGQQTDGIDTAFRSGNDTDLEICDDGHELVQSCSAIVALHPDEATDAIVDVAIKTRTPFVIVPCCVFSRLFPHRRMPNSKEPVCSYQELLEYLMAKDDSIQRTNLPFEGANVALWSTF